MIIAANSRKNTGPEENYTSSILRRTLTFSTWSVEQGPPYLHLLKSVLDGSSSSQKVNALLLIGDLCFDAKSKTLATSL